MTMDRLQQGVCRVYDLRFYSTEMMGKVFENNKINKKKKSPFHVGDMLQVLPRRIPALQWGFSGLLSTAYLRHIFCWSVGYCCKPEGLAEAVVAEAFVVIRQ